MKRNQSTKESFIVSCMLEVLSVDVVDVILLDSVQSNDQKLRRIRPNSPLFLERINHFNLPLYRLYNSCFGVEGDDDGDVVGEDDVPRRH